MEENKFLKMSVEEFDKYMCQTYPNQFCERNLPMNQTCMCWGFEIGKGWYSILNDLCAKFDAIKQATNISVTFQQVKEKYGSGRFYCQADPSQSKLDDKTTKCFCDMIYGLESQAESQTEQTCAECGEYKSEMLSIGHWVYDVCAECFRKTHPERINGLEDFEQKQKLAVELTNIIYKEDIDTVTNLCKMVKNATNRQINQ